MERIIVIGCSGSGKSTLARRLGERLGLPVVHLDALYWEPGWTEPDPERFRARVAEAVSGDRWVCDGGYFRRTAHLRLPRADLIIWLDRPLWLRLWRVTWRAVRYMGRTRPDMGPDCPEKVDLEFYGYIWNYDRKTRPRMEAAIAELAPHAPLIRLNSDREAAAFLEKLSASPTAAGGVPLRR